MLRCLWPAAAVLVIFLPTAPTAQAGDRDCGDFDTQGEAQEYSLSDPVTCANGVTIYTTFVVAFTGDEPPYPDIEPTTTTRWRCNGQSASG